MIKSIKRTLYIDGKLIEEYTQDPMADSELADMALIPLNNQRLKTKNYKMDNSSVLRK